MEGHRVEVLSIQKGRGHSFVARCECGEESDVRYPFTTAGMVAAWEDRHRADQVNRWPTITAPLVITCAESIANRQRGNDLRADELLKEAHGWYGRLRSLLADQEPTRPERTALESFELARNCP